MNKLLYHYNSLSFRRKIILTYAIMMMILIIIIFLILDRQLYDRQARQTLTSVQGQINEHIEFVNSRAAQGLTAARMFAYDQHVVKVFNKEYTEFFELVNDYSEYVVPFFQTLTGITPELVKWKLYTNGPLKQYTASFAQDLEIVKEQPWFENATMYHRIAWFADNGQLCLGIQQVSTTVTDHQNLIVFYYDKNKLFEGLELSNMNHAVIVSEMDGDSIFQNNLLDEREYDEKDLIMIDGFMAITGWRIRYIIPKKELITTYGRNAITIAFVIAELILILVSILISRNLIRRMEGLNQRVKSIARKGRPLNLYIDGNDEIDRLGNSIATMLDETQRLTKEAYENKFELQEAKFLVLQTQIKPHFLYNTLSLINWNAIKRGDQESSKLAQMLAQFYRAMLNHGDTMTTVRKEWMGVEAYLHIQMVFHNYGFESDLYLDESISECIVPNLLLQPLVENAILHGIDALENKRGVLAVRGEHRGERLYFEICDNGPGFPEDVLRNMSARSSDHYCLRNVRERLTLIYSTDFSFCLMNSEKGGAKVILDLPFQIRERHD